jgi:hypothetical protein
MSAQKDFLLGNNPLKRCLKKKQTINEITSLRKFQNGVIMRFKKKVIHGTAV